MNRAPAVAIALVGRRWWWVTLVVLALMVLLARLGVWQLNRLEERRAANAALIAALDSPPIDLNTQASTLTDQLPGELEMLANRDVVARGEFDFANQLIVKLQTYQDRTGAHIVTPLILAGTDTAVLVDRGWIPESDVSREGLSAYERPGLVAIDGYIALSEKISRQPSAVSAPTGELNEVFRVDIAAIQPDLPYTILPFYVKESPPETAQTAPPLLTEREVDLSEGPHLGYAVQWFIFSIGLGVAYVIFVNHQLRSSQNAPEGIHSGHTD